MCLYTCYVCVNVGMFVVYIVMFHGDYVYRQIYITTYREAWNTCLKSDLTSVTSHHSLKILLLFFFVILLLFLCFLFIFLQLCVAKTTSQSISLSFIFPCKSQQVHEGMYYYIDEQ